VTEGLDAHALEEHSAEQQRKYEPSRKRDMSAQAREHGGRRVAVAQERERENDGNKMKKMRGMGSTLPRPTLFIEGSTESIRCSSLLHTRHPNRPSATT
jgi:hypothetical protein